jgi:hypothetical protein
MTDDERQAELDALAESITVHTQAIAELKARTDEQNEMVRQMQEIRGEEIWSALSDIVSGQIAQRQTVREHTSPPPLHPSAIKPLRGNAKATVTPRRIGYTVHRTGAFFPERDRSWHLTRKGADRAVRRWVEG